MKAQGPTRRMVSGLVVSLVLLVAVVALAGCKKKRGYGGLDPVVVEGRVTEDGTDRGIPGVFVIANMRTYHSGGFGGHGSGGCTNGAILETGPDGRYVFRWSWKERGETPPEDLSIHFKFYKPGWEATIVGLPDSPKGVPKGSARMRPVSATIARDTHLRIYDVLEYCGQDRDDPLWLGMLHAQRDELVEAVCAVQPDPDLTGFENWAAILRAVLANLDLSQSQAQDFDALVQDRVPEAKPWYANITAPLRGPLDAKRREMVCTAMRNAGP